jgi:serine protease Do
MDAHSPRLFSFAATFLFFVGFCGLLTSAARGEEPKQAESSEEPAKPRPDEQRWVQELVKRTKPSLAVISVGGREGGQGGLGTGFVISSDGLIATNLHVIGEGRPITVELSDGRTLKVTKIQAWDRHFDLAILKVDAEGLTALPLGASRSLDKGDPLVIQGNPRGLKHSIVTGVLSEHRELEGRRMLQIAMPIEPGNSGGPVLDREGRVVGIVTMKSAVTENLGFAVEVEALQGLLDKPNPAPLDKWMTIGALDPRQWTPLFGASWRQRGGRILVEGTGEGFGGRSLCLSSDKPPVVPYEVATWVKLDDESGAAGLTVLADGNHRHFGFYPTAGKMRLTKFDGPDVTSWQVLIDEESPHYRQRAWNHIKVRVEADRLLCFVNDQQVFVHNDRDLDEFAPGGGKFGLAKFRQTQAEFKGFQIGERIANVHASSEARAASAATLRELPALSQLTPEKQEELGKTQSTGASLEDEARALEQRAKEMRLLANDVRTREECRELVALAGPDVAKVDLLRASLRIAKLDEPDIDVEIYVRMVDRLAKEVNESLAADATETTKLDALRRFMFDENGFHGSRTDYYNRANSYLNRVLDDREGLPITLAIVFIELAKRVGLKVEGVGLPGHFVVRFVPSEGEPQLLDVFEKAAVMPRADSDRLILAALGEPPGEQHYAATDDRAILKRVLSNLFRVAQESRDYEAMIRYLSATVAVDPDAARERGNLALLKFETGRNEIAARELDWFFDRKIEGVDLDRLRQMQQAFRRGKQ